MIKRTTFEIAPEKSKEFKEFIDKNAKTKEFWEQNKKDASKKVDKEYLNNLFSKKMSS